MINSKLTIAEESASPIEKIRAYTIALKIWDDKEKLVKRRNIVNPDASPEPLTALSRIKVQERKEKLMKGVIFVVRDESQQDYKTKEVITDRITKMGFKVSDTIPKESKKKTIHFDEEGVCDACRYTEQKKTGIDWVEREKELEELCDRHRRSDGSYDCLVPGSGGKDSFYAAHILKYKYGMHPLTVTWAPHIYTNW